MDLKQLNLGAHVSSAANSDAMSVLSVHTNLFQVFLSSPQRVVLDRESCTPIRDKARQIREAYPDARIIVHGPFWINIQAPNKLYKLSLKVIHQVLEVCQEFNFEGFVIHTGWRNVKDKKTGVITEYTLEQSFDQLCDSLRTLGARIEGSNVKLLIENTPNTGPKGVSATFALAAVKWCKLRGLNNVGLCFDTEHAYAYGTALSEFDRFLEAADVIHLNSVPAEVEHGKGLDRHTETPMYESAGISPGTLEGWVTRYAHKVKILEMDKKSAEATMLWLSSDRTARIVG